jgi:hypothetical protein
MPSFNQSERKRPMTTLPKAGMSSNASLKKGNANDQSVEDGNVSMDESNV